MSFSNIILRDMFYETLMILARKADDDIFW